MPSNRRLIGACLASGIFGVLVAVGQSVQRREEIQTRFDFINADGDSIASFTPADARASEEILRDILASLPERVVTKEPNLPTSTQPAITPTPGPGRSEATPVAGAPSVSSIDPVSAGSKDRGKPAGDDRKAIARKPATDAPSMSANVDKTLAQSPKGKPTPIASPNPATPSSRIVGWLESKSGTGRTILPIEADGQHATTKLP
jgi:hypothetical protein